ncbi:MAG: Hsp70 family protein [Chloroflexota bacterium]
MYFGIDFGTTHTTAVAFDGQNLTFIPLDHANSDPHLLRSMLYINRQHESILGVEAVQSYLKDNTGRLAKLEQKKVGTIENTVSRVTRMPLEPDGPIVIVYDVIIEEDVGALGRLLQSIKTGLRDPEYPGTTIFDRFFSIEDLITILLTHVKKSIKKKTGKDVKSATFGRPVQFSEDAEADALAEARLRKAAEIAGFESIDFLPEPVAAALFYTKDLTESKTILVFDFGGGTLDLTIMKSNPNEPLSTQILGVQGVLVGGDDLDSAIMREKVSPYFGVNDKIDRQGHPFPAHLAAKLNRWQTIPELSKVESIPIIRKARVNGTNPDGFLALECLALKNYGFSVFEIIEQAKRRLSSETETQLAMQVEDIDFDLTYARREFQTHILDELANTQQGIKNVLEKSGVAAEEIDVVVTTGGSSLIPIFRSILQRRFTNAELVHSNTFGSVAAGLAIHNFNQAETAVS